MTETEDRPKVWLHPPSLVISAIVIGYVLRVFVGGWLSLLPRVVGEGLGGVMLIASLAIFVAAIGAFAEAGEELNPATPSRSLLTLGPYRYSRNPIYLAMMLFGGGLGLATLNLWIVLLTALAGVSLHFLVIRPEEAYLERRFGDDYARYRKMVRRWV